jgi:hypothetical protein
VTIQYAKAMLTQETKARAFLMHKTSGFRKNHPDENGSITTHVVINN